MKALWTAAICVTLLLSLSCSSNSENVSGPGAMEKPGPIPGQSGESYFNSVCEEDSTSCNDACWFFCQNVREQNIKGILAGIECALDRFPHTDPDEFPNADLVSAFLTERLEARTCVLDVFPRGIIATYPGIKEFDISFLAGDDTTQIRIDVRLNACLTVQRCNGDPALKNGN